MKYRGPVVYSVFIQGHAESIRVEADQFSETDYWAEFYRDGRIVAAFRKETFLGHTVRAKNSHDTLLDEFEHSLELPEQVADLPEAFSEPRPLGRPRTRKRPLESSTGT